MLCRTKRVHLLRYIGVPLNWNQVLYILMLNDWLMFVLEVCPWAIWLVINIRTKLPLSIASLLAVVAAVLGSGCFISTNPSQKRGLLQMLVDPSSVRSLLFPVQTIYLLLQQFVSFSPFALHFITSSLMLRCKGIFFFLRNEVLFECILNIVKNVSVATRLDPWLATHTQRRQTDIFVLLLLLLLAPQKGRWKRREGDCKRGTNFATGSLGNDIKLGRLFHFMHIRCCTRQCHRFKFSVSVSVACRGHCQSMIQRCSDVEYLCCP